MAMAAKVAAEYAALDRGDFLDIVEPANTALVLAAARIPETATSFALYAEGFIRGYLFLKLME